MFCLDPLYFLLSALSLDNRTMVVFVISILFIEKAIQVFYFFFHQVVLRKSLKHAHVFCKLRHGEGDEENRRIRR